MSPSVSSPHLPRRSNPLSPSLIRRSLLTVNLSPEPHVEVENAGLCQHAECLRERVAHQFGAGHFDVPKGQ